MTAAQEAIRERGFKQVWIAEQLGIPPYSLTRKLRGLRPFTEDEARLLAALTRAPREVFLPTPSREVA